MQQTRSARKCGQATRDCFGITADWVRKWRDYFEPFNKPIIAKPKNDQENFTADHFLTVQRAQITKKNKLNNKFHTWFDVLPQYCNVVVPIRAGLLVPEPEGVHQLVKYDSFFVTSFTYGKRLRSRNIILSTNTGPTPNKKNTAMFLEGRWWG